MDGHERSGQYVTGMNRTWRHGLYTGTGQDRTRYGKDMEKTLTGHGMDTARRWTEVGRTGKTGREENGVQKIHPAWDLFFFILGLARFGQTHGEGGGGEEAGTLNAEPTELTEHSEYASS
jgi:hypothetical protein